MHQIALDISQLAFSYSPSSPLVIDVPRLEVLRGERVFLHGPSGSGKTTLLGLMAGILTASQGNIAVLGEDFTAMKSSSRDLFRGDHFGYIFQMFNLLPYLSVRENIELPLRMSAKKAKRVAGGWRLEVESLAKQLGINHFLDVPVTSLSVGQQQRVAAARALIGSPEIIIADEPTSALDMDRREDFLKLLFAAAKKAGSTVIFVSHDHSLRSLFDRVINLREINAASHMDGGV